LQSKIDYDLFCLSPDRRSSKLNELQKLKLIGILCTFFSQEDIKANKSERHFHFEVIFCGREGEAVLHEIRISFLIKLSVMALQYPLYGLFEDIAQWLYKIGSGKPYAEQVVGELVDKFILIPEKYEMYQYLIPLRSTALPFALFFLVHSVNDQTIGVPLAIVISNWLSNGLKDFLEVFREHPQLAEKFATQKFHHLLRYDNENGRRDDVHDCFHYCISIILQEWKGGPPINKLSCQSLLNNLANFFNLPKVGQERLVDNLENALRTGHISAQEVQPKLPEDFVKINGFSTRFSGFFEGE